MIDIDTQVRRWKPGHDCLDVARCLFQIHCGIRVAIIAHGAQGQCQVSAGAAAADTNTFGINLVFGCMSADVANGQPHVGYSLGNFEPRAAAMPYEEERIASVDDFFEEVQIALFGADDGFGWRPN